MYHVTARGNRGQTVFRDAEDRTCFLVLLDRVARRRSWRCWSWCLLGNHFHLLVRTPEPDLGDGMRDLNGRYAQRHNERHGLYGHVFQGRYAAKPVVRDAHLLGVVRYIARNPIEAGLARRVSDWPWSSHHRMLAGSSSNLVAVDDVLAFFADRGGDGLARYLELVTDGAPEPVVRTADADGIVPTPGALDDLLATCGRDEAMLRAYRDLGMSMPEIARAVGCHNATVSRRLRAAQLAA